MKRLLVHRYSFDAAFPSLLVFRGPPNCDRRDRDCCERRVARLGGGGIVNGRARCYLPVCIGWVARLLFAWSRAVSFDVAF